MKNKSTITILAILLVIVALLVWGNISRKKNIVTYQATDVACLPNGHQSAAVHIHPTLRVFVDGAEETVPADIGISATCMSEIHTHDTSGAIHVESFSAERAKEFTLADFFAVWNRTPEREGYSLEMFLDGELRQSSGEIPLEDHGNIELRYSSL